MPLLDTTPTLEDVTPFVPGNPVVQPTPEYKEPAKAERASCWYG